ncbi:MAG: hypothetical protein ITG02_09205 [Patulibacter sp.]|nr:hypothetical protein [Patulibacter sp.]
MPRLDRTPLLRIALLLAAAAGIGLAIWLAFGRSAFVNYDSAWSLNWARDLWSGARPNLDRPFSPTPHPLSDLFSGLLAPLSTAGPAGGAVGTGSEAVLIVVALFFLGALGVVTYLLGRAWFGVGAGVLAAVLILTREPVLSYGLRTYLDLPYAVFLLLALLTETRRPRNGYRTVAWLTLAGLLRPEAWLLTAAYVGYLVVAAARDGGPVLAPKVRAWSARVPWKRLAGIVAVSLIAPLGWLVEGWVLAGDPLLALTGTQQNADDLGRVTGIGSAFTVMPRRLGEIVREPVLLAAAGGLVLSLLFLRRRALLGLGAAIAAGFGFFVLAATGLPLLTRYLVFPAAIVILFAAAGLLGWQRLPADHRWRRPWQAFSAIALVALLVFLPSQIDRLDRLERALSLQQSVIGDLRTVVGDGLRASDDTDVCNGVSPKFATPDPERIVRDPWVALPNHRAVPQVRLWMGTDPQGRSQTVQAFEPGTRPKYLLIPSSERVARGFILDAADRGKGLPVPPRGSTLIARHGSWLVYRTWPGGSPACAAWIRERLR